VNHHSKSTQNRTAIITGSGRGIGKETAVMLANKVENIVLCSRTKDEINDVVNEIREINNHVNVQDKDVMLASRPRLILS
jgi:short-subunit dehydrogenase